MAAQKENLEVDSAAAGSQPIEVITENGFSIVRPGEGDGPRRLPEGEYVFIVRDPHGSELEITVGLDPEVVIEIIARSRGRLAGNSSYWICCAERHLAEYLWENDTCPIDGKLRVEQLTLEDLNLGTRWGTT